MQPIDDDLDRNPVASDLHPTPWRLEALDGGVDDYQILDANGLAIAGCGPYDPPTVSKVDGERIVRLVNAEAEVVEALRLAECGVVALASQARVSPWDRHLDAIRRALAALRGEAGKGGAATEQDPHAVASLAVAWSSYHGLALATGNCGDGIDRRCLGCDELRKLRR